MSLRTIGYGGRKPADFTGLFRLVKNGLKIAADVRLRPDRPSMGVCAEAKTSDKPSFSYYYLLKIADWFIVKEK
jgi:hypothetical protein